MMDTAQQQLYALYEDLARARANYDLTSVYQEEEQLTEYIDLTISAIATMERAGTTLPADTEIPRASWYKDDD